MVDVGFGMLGGVTAWALLIYYDHLVRPLPTPHNRAAPTDPERRRTQTAYRAKRIGGATFVASAVVAGAASADYRPVMWAAFGVGAVGLGAWEFGRGVLIRQSLPRQRRRSHEPR